MLNEMDEDHYWFHKIIWTDAANSKPSNHVNGHNCIGVRKIQTSEWKLNWTKQMCLGWHFFFWSTQNILF
jgi:hypothetical protein